MPYTLKLLVIHCTATPAGREVSAEEIRHTPSLSIAVTGDTRPARRRRLGSGTGRVLGGVLSAGGAPLFGRGKTASSSSLPF